MPSSFQRGDKRKLAGLTFRVLKQAAASGPLGDEEDVVDPRLLKRFGAIKERALERGALEADDLAARLKAAAKAVAVAKNQVRTAKRADKPAAKQALKEAEIHLRTVQSAYNVHGR